MKIGVECGKVAVDEKEDVESTGDNGRKSRRSLFELIVNILLFIVAVVFIGLGAYAWKRILFREPPSMTMISSVYTSNATTNVYYGVPAPGSSVPINPPAGPVIDPNVLGMLNWPEVFQHEGGLEVYYGPAVTGEWACWMNNGTNVTQSCLRECYRVLGSPFVVSTFEGQCAGYAKEELTIKFWQGSREPTPEKSQGPQFYQLKAIRLLPNFKLFPVKATRPTVTIKMQLLNMSYSDHTKMCLSFCLLHPDCHSCSAFPEEPMQVDQAADKVVGRVGYNGTLTCLLFVNKGTIEDPIKMDIRPSNGTVSYITAQGNITRVS